MPNVIDVSLIFNAGRIWGCTTLVATKDAIKPRRLRDTIFVAFSMISSFICLILFHIYILKYEGEDEQDPTSIFILFARVYMYFVCLYADDVLTIVWSWKIRSVVSQLRNFDRVTFHVAENRNTIRIICRVLIVTNAIFWAIASYLTYRIELRTPVFRATLYFVIYISTNTQILIFACILLLIEERFRHLCNMVTFSKGNKLMVLDRTTGYFTLQQIWWLHSCLVNATEMINSVYAIQLLLWITSLSVNLLSRIYSLGGHTFSNEGKIREAMLAINCVWNLGLITGVCHLTAYQANRVGELIFSPSSTASMKRVFLQENLEAVAYFQLRKVYFFTISGIIRVNLPLLLSIFSALITYLVILL